MTSRLLLLVSISILLVTTIVVALFGVVPIPEYETFPSGKGFNGKLIYHVEFQSENIIPIKVIAFATFDFCVGLELLSNSTISW